MKKLVIFLIVLVLVSGCKKKTYEGYYCNYKEQGVIIALLDQDVSSSDKETIITKINSYDGLLNYDFISKEELGNDTTDLYDTYFIYFNSTNIENYLLDLQNTKGVHEATNSNIKSSLSLYNFDKNSYSFKNMLESEDSITGTYKVKKSEIKFDNEDVPKIYLKDEFLCLDEECNKVLTKTNELCE